MATGKMPVAGQIASDFELPDYTQTLRLLSELVSRGRLALVFYRGDW